MKITKTVILIAVCVILFSVAITYGYVKLVNKSIGGYYNMQTNSSVVTTTFGSLISSQVVYGTAAGNAGQTTNLTWRIASSSLGIGNNFPSSTLHVVNGAVTTTIIFGSPQSATNKAVQCLWNGTNYTKISFPANSVTPTYATSTSC